MEINLPHSASFTVSKGKPYLCCLYYCRFCFKRRRLAAAAHRRRRSGAWRRHRIDGAAATPSRRSAASARGRVKRGDVSAAWHRKAGENKTSWRIAWRHGAAASSRQASASRQHQAAARKRRRRQSSISVNGGGGGPRLPHALPATHHTTLPACLPALPARQMATGENGINGAARASRDILRISSRGAYRVARTQRAPAARTRAGGEGVKAASVIIARRARAADDQVEW